MESDFKVLRKSKIGLPRIYEPGSCNRRSTAGRVTASSGMRTRSSAIGSTSACQRPIIGPFGRGNSRQSRRAKRPCLPQAPPVKRDQPLPVTLGGRFCRSTSAAGRRNRDGHRGRVRSRRRCRPARIGCGVLRPSAEAPDYRARRKLCRARL